MVTARERAREAVKEQAYSWKRGADPFVHYADAASDVWEQEYRELVEEIKKSTYRTALLEKAKGVLGEG